LKKIVAKPYRERVDNQERWNVLMNRQNLNPKQVDEALKTLGKKLGLSPEQLRKELESGKFDKILQNLSAKESATVQNVLQNPKMMEKLMHSPQAKALMEKLMGK
jgi:wobble nucleotide-excising tRNase